MTQLQKYAGKSAFTDLRSLLQQLFSSGSDRNAGIFEALSRQLVPFGGNWLESGHNAAQNRSENSAGKHASVGQNEVASENRYSVLYLLHEQYHHIGCSTQSEAQSLMSLMMTDEKRIPVGIYDAKSDLFEWEIIGQYFHSKDPIEAQESRRNHILTIARALRRRDASWQPGYLQKPSFFA